MDEAQRGKAKEAARAALRHYKKAGRDLPWRRTRDPYHIFVSEMMLQQTQVARVVPKFEAFITRFPDWQSLSAASLPALLRQWQGLGYNRRAKFLHDAACIVVEQHGGLLPRDPTAIEALPGVGHYTARAIAAFAFGVGEPLLETNVRTVFLHHCFPGNGRVADAALLSCVAEALRGQEPHLFYSALMDYGSYLKASGVRLNARARGYVKQSPFAGSTRQARGRVIAHLSRGARTRDSLEKKVAHPHFDEALASLIRDGLIGVRKGRVALLEVSNAARNRNTTKNYRAPQKRRK